MQPATSLAILAFDTLDRRQLGVEKAERDLARRVVDVPAEDMPQYVQATTAIAAKRNLYREQHGL